MTGNIGCGKSSISAILADHGVEIIDADRISREIYDNEEVLLIMKEKFPTAVDESGVDRKKLGEIVFSDENKLALLNEITHRKIKEITVERMDSSKAKAVCIDAALLIEAGFDKLVDRLIVVSCDEEVEIERIIKRDGITKEEALRRIRSQMPQEEKIKKADFNIDNSNTYEELLEKTNSLIKILQKSYKI